MGSSGILCVNGGPLRERMKATTVLHTLVPRFNSLFSRSIVCSTV
jgi:hypothetical protein